MDLQLTNKRALVTGSTTGIGLAIAEGLLKEGASVVINGRGKDKVDAVVKQLKEKYPAAGVQGIAADFSKADEVDALIAALPEVDILVNNVGIFEPKAFTEIADADWLKFYEVNVLSGVRLSRAYLPKMLQQNEGRIIFISSESALNIPEEMIHYGMTKTAQLAVSRGLAELTKKTKVTVNSVLPGPTASDGVTEMISTWSKQQNITVKEAEVEFFKTLRPTSLLQRFAAPAEIANLVVYIASPLSSATNGASLRADGGVAKFIV
ncbi:SDR family NAD(P)-dependent oxidoreductase [Deminuibacter soli]|uniref:SDR family NAD(P)-dependent oxidoreductase n=1 Tax=Deminuibacter soli TaxID=2291815 RepID=A0A3E1NQK3_9BACT|nr:SDR family oxidoreductase [Deminuibacter soli]RFM30202.1 SDR family NAD(P)-dependent oxidoreductase [Deminuibacter soli]